MKKFVTAPSPPIIAFAVAVIGLGAIALDLRYDRHDETMTSAATTILSAQAAGATVSPTDDTVMGP